VLINSNVEGTFDEVVVTQSLVALCCILCSMGRDYLMLMVLDYASITVIISQLSDFFWMFRSCLVSTKNQKLFKILYHIKSYGICMEH